jgi:hypothetical protein
MIVAYETELSIVSQSPSYNAQNDRDRLTEQLEQADVRTWTSIDDEIVQDLERLHGPGRKAHDLLVLFPLCLGLLFIVLVSRPLQRFPPFRIDLVEQDISSSRLDGLAFLASGRRSLFGRDGPVDGTCKPHTEVDPDPVVHGLVQRLGIVGEIKVCEETERAECKGEDRGYDPLKEPRGEEDRAVTAELRRRDVDRFEFVLESDLL